MQNRQIGQQKRLPCTWCLKTDTENLFFFFSKARAIFSEGCKIDLRNAKTSPLSHTLTEWLSVSWIVITKSWIKALFLRNILKSKVNSRWLFYTASPRGGTRQQSIHPAVHFDQLSVLIGVMSRVLNSFTFSKKKTIMAADAWGNCVSHRVIENRLD